MTSHYHRIKQRTRLLMDEALDAVRRGFRSDDESILQPLALTQLEERILMSASPVAIVADLPDALPGFEPDSGPLEFSGSDVSLNQQSINTVGEADTDSSILATVELVVIDPSAEDFEQLVADLTAQTDRIMEVLVLNPHEDGIAQITDALNGLDRVSAIHLVSHGDEGEILLGTSVLSLRSLDRYAAEIVGWQGSMTADADLLIYGCDMAGSADGRELVDSLNILTGADVAASDDLTGHEKLGGNWDLEYDVGVIETSVAFSDGLQQDWMNVLAAVTVTTTADENDGDTTNIGTLLSTPGGSGISLREAVIAANNTVASDTITLTEGIYLLQNGQLSITEDLVINSSGKSTNTVVDAMNNSRVFNVDNSAIVTFSDLTVQRGDAASGGGLYVRTGADVTVERSVLQNNDTNSGGAIRNAGTLTLRDVEVIDNSANFGAGLRNDGTATIERSLFFDNTADRGGAIDNQGTITSIVNTTISGNKINGGGVGGAAINTVGSIAVTNSTIVNNIAPGSVGAIRLTGAGDVVLRNSILTGNTGQNVNGSNTITSADFNIVDDITSLTAVALNDQTGVGLDPLLDADLDDHGGYTRTHALRSGSIAIDPVGMTGAPADDQRGVLRSDGTPDIGAYETPVTFVVTSTADSLAVGTLRWAIAEANLLPGQNRIAFDIPDSDAGHFYYQDNGAAGFSAAVTTVLDDGSISDFDVDDPYGQHSWFRIDINPGLSELTVTDDVIIDGYTQSGARRNTLAMGNDAAIRIELTSTGADTFRGLTFDTGADGSLVRGLAVNSFEYSGIMVDYDVDNVTVEGNFIGTDITGTQDFGNNDAGVQLRGDNNTVGGTLVGDRNVISGSNNRGVSFFSGGTLTGNVIQNNYIGVDATGLADLGNLTAGIQLYNSDLGIVRDNVISGNTGDGIWFRDIASFNTNNTIAGNIIGLGADGVTVIANDANGILIQEGSGNTIGGTLISDRNVISGNASNGIRLNSANSDSNLIYGNYIGTTSDGLAAAGNQQHGVGLNSGASNNQIGSELAGAGNVISGNTGYGVRLTGGGTRGNTVAGNLIGVDQTGASSLSLSNLNGGVLVTSSSSDNFIGGTLDGEGNTIASLAVGTFGVELTSGTGNLVSQNSIFDTADKGISVLGANTDITAAAVTNAVQNGAFLNVTGTYLDAAQAGNLLTVEIFESPTNAPAQGKTYLGTGTLQLDGSGSGVLNVTVNSTSTPGSFITVTVTDPSNNTSEFSNAVAPVVRNTALWFESNGTTTGTGASPIGWESNNIVAFNDPNLSFGEGTTNGTFSLPIGFQPTEPLRAIHYVDTDVTVGTTGTTFDLQEGDLLLVFNITPTPITIGGAVDVLRDDVVLFRPGAGMDYTSGTYTKLLDNPIQDGATPKNIHAISLVEADTMVGGKLLTEGTFIIARSNDGSTIHQNIYTYNPTSVGAGTTSNENEVLLLDGATLDFGSRQVQGIEMLESNVTLGGVNLLAGQLLVSLNGAQTLNSSDGIPGNEFTTEATDIFYLNITQTEQDTVPGTTAVATMLFDGSNVGLDDADSNEFINGITVINSVTANLAPIAVHNGPYTISEGDGVTLDATGSSDPNTDPLTYDWDLNNDGTYDIVGNVASTQALTWAQLQGYGINDGNTAGLDYTVNLRVNDDQGNSTVVSTTITVNNVAPVITVSGSATSIEDSVYSLTLSASDFGLDTVSEWTVDWGDGTVISYTTPFPATFDHTYTRGGDYEILVSATDEDGTFAKRNLIVPSFNFGSETVATYDSVSGALITTFQSTSGDLNRPYASAIGAGGDIYVSGFSSDNVVRFDSSGNYLGEFVTSGLGGLNGATGLTFGQDGYLYVASFYTDEVLRYDATGAFIDVFGEDGSGLNGSTGIAFQPGGDLYVTSWGNGKVFKYDGIEGGSPVSVIGAGLAGPEQIAFDDAGDLWIADGYNDEIAKYDGTLNSFAPVGAYASGLLLSPEGILYVSHVSTGNIQMLDASTGASLGMLATGITNPNHLTFAPDLQVSVAHVADTASVTNSITLEETQTTSGLVITRNPADGAEVSHYQITNISNGTLYQSNGTTAINNGDFITVAEGAAGLRFTPSPAYFGTATFDVQASVTDDNSGLGGGVVTASITVTNVNDAPDLTPANPAFSPSTDEETVSAAFQVSTFISGTWTDDDGDTAGIAITGLTGAGTWQYRVGAGAWTNIGSVDGTSALLLQSTDNVRYLPDGQNGETASISYHAWDQTGTTTGQQGTKQNVASIGTGTDKPFSTLTDTATLSITDVNDAPTMTAAAPSMTVIDEDSVSTGTTVSSIVGASISDVDSASSEGLAIVGSVGNGTWEYSLNGGTTWSAVGAVSGNQALLLRDTDLVRYTGDAANAETASLTYHAWDQTGTTTGQQGTKQDVLLIGTGTDKTFSTATDAVSISVTAVNDAPTLTPAAPALSAIDENSVSTGTAVSSIVGTSISDVDTAASEGIAVVGSVGNGIWEYSINGGTSWSAVGAVSVNQALLLRDTDLVRYTGDSVNAETASLTYHAWDQTGITSGQQGTKQDLLLIGTGTDKTFSTATDAVSVSVTAVNDAPVLTAIAQALVATDENSTSAGSTVASFVGASINDVDSAASTGIAIVSSVGNGTWEFSINGGTTWTAVGAVNGNQALLLRNTDLVRYTGDAANAETASLTYHAWDQTGTTTGQQGTKQDLLLIGTGTDKTFSTASDAVSISATAVNDAPTLTPAAPALISIDEDSISTGSAVSSIVGASISDVDAAASAGIAIVGSVGNGTWEFSINGGTTWGSVGTVSGNQALLLRDTDLVRYTGDAANAETASLTYHAWDQTGTTTGQQGTKQDLLLIGTGTDKTFSTATDAVSINVTAVNDAPVLTAATPTLIAIDENSTSGGAAITSIVGTTISDVDSGASAGIAITGLVGNGTWEFSTDAGATWSMAGTVNSAQALLLRDVDLIRYTGDGANGETATFSYCAWDQTGSTSGLEGTKFSIGIPGADTPFSTTINTGSIIVTDVNDAPTLAAASPSLGSIDESSTSAGSSVASIVGATISDIDAAAIGGIVISGISGNGLWEFSTDSGATWTNVGTVNSASALLLRDIDEVRYSGDGANSETATLTYRAWDQTGVTSGAEGTKVAIGVPGGSTAFSTSTNTASITVTDVNDAPTMAASSPSLGVIDEDSTSVGTTVSSIVGSTISDLDTGASEGIAIVSLVGNGLWEFSTNGGSSWNAAGTTNTSQALLLRDVDLLRYNGDGVNGETATFTWHAWDQTGSTAGREGTQVPVGTPGGVSPFSVTTNTGSITVTDVNDAPTIAAGNPSLGSIDEDSTSAGLTVSSIVGGSISDVDTGASEGIAIFGLTGNGTWEFSTDAGGTWTAIGAVDATQTLLLRDADLVRYTGDGADSETATFTYRAWDQTGTTAGAEGTKITMGAPGGTGRFSTSARTASIIVTAVNDAPTMTAASPSLGSIDENSTSAGTTISTIVGGTIADNDSGASEGIALTGLSGNGSWEFSTDVGSSWNATGFVSATQALLLRDIDLLRYSGDDSNGETATFTWQAWDQSGATSGSEGTKVSIGTGGGTSAFSTASNSGTITVTDVNDAPVLTASSPSVGITDEDSTTAPVTVASFAGASVSDVDASSIEGIAVIAASGAGVWEYSTDAGVTWLTIAAVNDNQALLLRDTDLVRYTGDGINGETATLSYHGWDRTGVTAGAEGTKVNVTTTGLTTPFSVLSDTATLTVNEINDAASISLTPVVGKLNEGIENTSPVVVATFVIADDGTGTNTLTLSGADASLFQISGTNLELKSGTRLVFDTNPVLNVTVNLDDAAIPGSPEDTASHVVIVNDVIGPVADADPTPDQVLENAAVGTVVGISAQAVDSDPGDFITYSLSSNPGNLFVIDSNTGLVTTNVALDRETADRHVITVLATSSDSGTSYRDFTISVTDENDNAPVITPGQSLTIYDKARNGPLFGHIAGTDVDLIGTHGGWTIVTGNHDGALAIDLVTGALRVQENNKLEFGQKPIYVLGISYSDGVNVSAVTTVTVQVIGDIQAPAIVVQPTAEKDSEPTDDTTTTEAEQIENILLPPVQPEPPVVVNAPQHQAVESQPPLPILVPQSVEPSDQETLVFIIDIASQDLVKATALRDLDSTPRVISMTGSAEQEYTVDHLTTSFSATGDTWRNLDNLKRDVRSDISFENVVVETVTTVSAGLTVGYIAWALRGGMLLSGLLAHMPLWTMIDPLLVVDGVVPDEEDGDSIEDIVDRQSHNQVEPSLQTPEF